MMSNNLDVLLRFRRMRKLQEPCSLKKSNIIISRQEQDRWHWLNNSKRMTRLKMTKRMNTMMISFIVLMRKNLGKK